MDAGPLTPKSYRCGTHRLVDPDETVARLRPHLGALGITRLANVTGLDRVGVPVVMVCRPNSCSIAVHQGKGLTLAAARASGLMEAAEVAHGERVVLRRRVSSYARLSRGAAVVDVARLPRRPNAEVHYRRIPWVQGRDVLTDEPIWVPYELVYTRYTAVLRPWRCFEATTNGLASGNCELEALSHGLCEVIERDGFSRWIRLPRAAQDRTRLDLATVDDASNWELIGRFEAADIAVAVWDMTSGNRVPVFGCQIQDRDVTYQRRVAATWGYGCHPTRGVALSRALTEAAQSRLTWIAGSRDDIGPDTYARHLAQREVERERSYLEVRAPTRRFTDVPSFEADTFEEDVSWLLGRLTATGIRQVATVDLTLPEFAIPVVRVVVPGLEPGTEPRRQPPRRLSVTAARRAIQSPRAAARDPAER